MECFHIISIASLPRRWFHMKISLAPRLRFMSIATFADTQRHVCLSRKKLKFVTFTDVINTQTAKTVLEPFNLQQGIFIHLLSNLIELTCVDELREMIEQNIWLTQ